MYISVGNQTVAGDKPRKVVKFTTKVTLLSICRALLGLVLAPAISTIDCGDGERSIISLHSIYFAVRAHFFYVTLQ